VTWGTVPLLPGKYDIEQYFGDEHLDLGVIEQTIVILTAGPLQFRQNNRIFSEVA
jgi:hypothetical protein